MKSELLILCAVFVSLTCQQQPNIHEESEQFVEVLSEHLEEEIMEEEIPSPSFPVTPETAIDGEDDVIPEVHIEDSLPASVEEEHAAAAVMEQIMDDDVGEIKAANGTNITSVTNATKINNRYSSRRVTCLVKEILHNDTLEPNETPSHEEKENEEKENSTTITPMNATSFLSLLARQIDSNVTNRTQPAQCSLTFFYASWCPFSAAAAPHFKGLARLFPDIQMLAVDTHTHYGINTQFGIMSLPTIFLFHNSKPIAKFNGSEFNITYFADYVTIYTTMEPYGNVTTIDADYEGPLSELPIPVTDYYLYMAWTFIIVIILSRIFVSSWCKRLIESVRNTWREAEMHDHQD